jgi:hypothetical protein
VRLGFGPLGTGGGREQIELALELVEAPVEQLAVGDVLLHARCSESRVARVTNVDVITAVTMAMKAVPSSITTAPTSLPAACAGETSP